MKIDDRRGERKTSKFRNLHPMDVFAWRDNPQRPCIKLDTGTYIAADTGVVFTLSRDGSVAEVLPLNATLVIEDPTP